MNVVSQSISHFGNSKLPNITAPLLMHQDTEISSRTWLPEPHKPIVPYLWLLHPKENSKLVSLKTDKLENTPYLPILWESNKWSFAQTRWTKKPLTGPNPVTKKSRRKLLTILRRLVTIPPTSHSSHYPDGSEITCLKDHQILLGIRAQPSLKLLMLLPHQRDQPISHFVSHFRTFTRLVVSERCQSVELKPVS